MTSWQFPAKTFLLGEYAALTGAPALLLTTTPYFELHLTDSNALINIHPASPAGRWWLAHQPQDWGLRWHDPYQSVGGLGASTAQFLGVFSAYHAISKQRFTRHELQFAYRNYAWSGQGQPPSGYDLLAQFTGGGCVYVNGLQQTILSWPFANLAFILVHTGHKVATHDHLAQLNLTTDLTELVQLVEHGYHAFQQGNNEQLITTVNAYYTALNRLHLVAPHTQALIKQLRHCPHILGAKGCGALGADVILLLTPTNALMSTEQYLTTSGLRILATSNMLAAPGSQK